MGACASRPRMVDSSPLEEVNGGGSNATIPTTTERNLSTSQYSSGTTTTDGKTSATSMGSSIMQSSTCSEDLEYLAFPKGRILPLPKLKVFKFVELEIATKNFKVENLLGEGGFGKVYKGWVNETTLAPSKSGYGKAVAVKKLNSESVQGWSEWKSEVDFLGRLSHPNLVKLLGYCSEGQELLLVYEFMAKGSLENHLFRRSSASYILNWNQRLKIATDAARALAFLHTSDEKIIYRDFKASNVLLDSNYNAKIADFGLAKEGPVSGETHVSTRVMGTYGYVAPEYATTGHLYVKSDVYGFGVVLLELLSSQRTLDLKRMAEQRNFVIWARPLLHDRKSFIRVMDPQLDGQYPSKVAFETCRLASWCLAFEPKNRPSMNDVVERLESIEAMKGETDEVRLRPPQPGARNPSRSTTQHQFLHHP